MKKAMTYHELVEKVRTALVVKADASKIEEQIAVQVNVTGEAEGAFYILIKDGEIFVEPYDYNDRDILVTCDGADMLAIAQGKKKFETALLKGAIKFEGNIEKAKKLAAIMPTKSKKAKSEEEAPAETAEETPAKEKTKRTRKTKTVAVEADTPVEGQLSITAEAEKTVEKAKKPRKNTKKTDK